MRFYQKKKKNFFYFKTETKVKKKFCLRGVLAIHNHAQTGSYRKYYADLTIALSWTVHK